MMNQSAATVPALRVQFPKKAKCLFQPAPYKVFHGGRGGFATTGQPNIAGAWTVQRTASNAEGSLHNANSIGTSTTAAGGLPNITMQTLGVAGNSAAASGDIAFLDWGGASQPGALAPIFHFRVNAACIQRVAGTCF